jgi:predicted MFS family arabinose efflux permease
LERRRLLAAMLGCTVIGLGVMALAPSLAVFGSAAVVVGLTSVATHVIVPLAAAIAPAGQQGRVVGTVMSGLLFGILLSRMVSGLVASVAGWRTVFGLAALVNAGVAVLLWRELPALAPAARMRYPALLGSVLQLVREEPVLRRRIVYGALAFASFNVFWTSYGFLVARPPYEWNEAQIGMFALLGAVGALAVKFTGWLADRGLTRIMTGGFLTIMALSYILLAIGANSVLALGVGVVLMDLGCQGAHVTNQSVVFPLRPDARSRLNTAYMTSLFVAFSIGGALSAVVYPVYGWVGVSILGGVFPAVAVLLWVAETTRARSGQPPAEVRAQEAGIAS